jgi:hypothetical protein
MQRKQINLNRFLRVIAQFDGPPKNLLEVVQTAKNIEIAVMTLDAGINIKVCMGIMSCARNAQ